jgi:hypothetical protein
MTKTAAAIVCALILLMDITLSHAYPSEWRGQLRERINDDRARIEFGINNGSLTHHEAAQLYRQLDKIIYKLDRMKADGYLSRFERETLNYDLERLEKHIRREKRDFDRRW